MKTRIKELLILTLRSQTAGSRCLADPIRACLSFSVYLSGCHKEMIFEYHTSVFPSSELLNSICFLDETTRNSQQCCKKLSNWLVLKGCTRARRRIWMGFLFIEMLHSIPQLKLHRQALILFSVVNFPCRWKDLNNS